MPEVVESIVERRAATVGQACLPPSRNWRFRFEIDRSDTFERRAASARLNSPEMTEQTSLNLSSDRENISQTICPVRLKRFMVQSGSPALVNGALADSYGVNHEQFLDRIPEATSEPSLEELAASAGAEDLFLFRRVGANRFAHIGGVGRGVGWAGIVELGLEDELLVGGALESGAPFRRCELGFHHVVGPYYARVSAIVPIDTDVFAVFGSSQDSLMEPSDAELRELAAFAGSSIREVTAAKRLADELEVVTAVSDLLGSPTGSFDEAAESVTAHAARALSCEVGVLYVPSRQSVAVFDPNNQLRCSSGKIVAAMAEISSGGNLPLCIQESLERELPSPFSNSDGTIAYYLLALDEPKRAVLLLAHTNRAPRGFTLLCQSLGVRLVKAAGPLLVTALMRDDLRQDLSRAAGQARSDALTGLANRLAWDEALANHVPSGLPASVIQVDCRGLKQANERHGHHVGDQLLRRTAVLLQGATRDDDLVARVGGDEFAVLLRESDEATAASIVERIRSAIDSEPSFETVTLGVAIGTATTQTGDLASAQRSADERMRASKRAASPA